MVNLAIYSTPHHPTLPRHATSNTQATLCAVIVAQQYTKLPSATRWQHQRGTSFSEIQAKKLTTSPLLSKAAALGWARAVGVLLLNKQAT